MKKVAIVENGWGKIVSYAWVSGCKEYIYEHHLDVQIYIFNIFTNVNMDEKNNLGELNIINLPDFSKFDGVILELTNLMNKDWKNQVIETIQKANVPTVILGEMGSDFYFSGIDNYYAMEQIVEHMITEHGAKTLNFVGGDISNQENHLRLLAYKDILEKYGIPVEEERIFQKTFEVSTGMEAFDYFIAQNLIPDAVICANDNIAVGVIHEAQTMGYKVPDDFVVSGFDDFEKASYCTPKITTVDFKKEDLTYNAMKILDRVWNGETNVEDELAEARCMFQESCGCNSITHGNLEKFVMNNFVQEDKENKADSFLMMMKGSLKHCKSFSEVAACLPDYLYTFKYDELYIIINEDFLVPDAVKIVDSYIKKTMVTWGYSANMTVLLQTSENQIITGVPLEKGQLLPDEDDMGSGEFFLFSPLHFEDKEVGYMVLKNCDQLMDSKLLYEILNMLMECMESIFKNLILEKFIRLNEEDK